jgi:uncharacterized membrane protein YczE
VFVLRLLQLNVGLLLYGLSVALMVEANVGLGPWDVFHQGISLLTPLSFGQAMVAAGLAVLVYSVLGPKVRVGVGTVLNMLLIGVWADVFLGLPGFPHPSGYALGLALFVAGLAMTGLATGLYITAGLGAGPRDGFVLGVAKVTGASVRLVRTLTEVSVLALGWVMGGSVGLGTVLFALTAGPLMQFFLRLFRGLDARYAAMSTKDKRGAAVTPASEAGKG